MRSNISLKSIFNLILFALYVNSEVLNDGAVHNTTNDLEVHRDSIVLSRRKRFIVFPEGSSLQLVFCNTFPTIFAIGDIFLFGYTAAMAWELPQDPYSPFMHHADPLHRRVDSKNIYYTDYDGKVLFKKPYKRKPIVNPAFAKRSVDKAANTNAAEFEKGTIFEKGPPFQIDRQQMHRQHKREFSEQMNERSVEFHRTSRASLYEKIESLLVAGTVAGLGSDGRQCMLKVLCQVGQTTHQEQSSFLQEILRAVFTLPDGKVFEREYHQEYDAAHFTRGSCDEMYPECTTTLSEPSLGFSS